MLDEVLRTVIAAHAVASLCCIEYYFSGFFSILLLLDIILLGGLEEHPVAIKESDNWITFTNVLQLRS